MSWLLFNLSLIHIFLAPGFYAKQDIRTPVKIAVVVLVLTQLMNLLFVPLYEMCIRDRTFCMVCAGAARSCTGGRAIAASILAA